MVGPLVTTPSLVNYIPLQNQIICQPPALHCLTSEPIIQRKGKRNKFIINERGEFFKTKT